jgi:EpsI family protein
MRFQAWSAVLLLVLTAALLHARGDVDKVPPSEPLANLPMTIDAMNATEYPLDDEVLSVLGKGIFLNRVYNPIHPSTPADAAPVGLFIGYFPTQRTGQAIHSPQHCLPGAGWTFESSGTTTFTDTAGKPYTVGDYLISDGKSRQEVLYWYRSHGRSIASDYAAKFYTLADSIRYNRTDAALVRVITPLANGEDRASAHARAITFARQMAPLLPAYIPD